MYKDLYKLARKIIHDTVNSLLKGDEFDYSDDFDVLFEHVTVSPAKINFNHDVSTNVSFVFSNVFNIKPLILAEKIKDKLVLSSIIESIEIIKPGFINFNFVSSFWNDFFLTVNSLESEFGKRSLNHSKTINIEFVSANPTGPLHIGHTRNAVLLDIIANVYTFLGYKVCREYYVNDMGTQIETLLESSFLRYKEVLGHNIGDIKEGLYPGEYLKKVGTYLVKKYDNSLLDMNKIDCFKLIKEDVISIMMSDIKYQLKRLGIIHDNFVSEESLYLDNYQSIVFDILKKQELLYEYENLIAPKGGGVNNNWVQRNTLFFKSTKFGDDEDRILKKSNGEATYFASDIIYHYNKLERGFSDFIIGLGEDHKGYVARIQSVVKALSNNTKNIKVKISNIVNFIKAGEKVKMSKRSGSFVTLQDILDEVSQDSIRYMMISRKSDMVLDFDFAKVKQQNKNNQIFYIQYAYVRIISVLTKAGDRYSTNDVDITLLKNQHEKNLIRLMSRFSYTVEYVFKTLEPHAFTVFLNDIAESFHSLWNVGIADDSMRFIVENDSKVTASRLYLLRTLKIIIGNTLEILGIKPLEKM